MMMALGFAFFIAGRTVIWSNESSSFYGNANRRACAMPLWMQFQIATRPNPRPLWGIWMLALVSANLFSMLGSIFFLTRANSF